MKYLAGDYDVVVVGAGLLQPVATADNMTVVIKIDNNFLPFMVYPPLNVDNVCIDYALIVFYQNR